VKSRGRGGERERERERERKAVVFNAAVNCCDYVTLMVDERIRIWRICGLKVTEKYRSTRRKTYPSATLSTKNPDGWIKNGKISYYRVVSSFPATSGLFDPDTL
jgi:hypothetical protein